MKHKSGYRLINLFVLVFIMILSSCTNSHNWPQFRGPESNMLPAGKNLPEEWGNDKNVKWTYELDGTGWSSPIVWGNRVFIASTFPEKVNPVPERGPMPGPTPEGEEGPQPGQMPQPGQGPQQGQMPQPGQGPGGPRPEDNDTSYLKEIYRWELTCIDLNTGKELWKQVAYKGSPRVMKQPMNTYASETPATDGERIFAYFGMTGLFCYDMDGKLLWKRDLGAYKTQGGWGTGSSPVIYQDVLYIKVDNEVNSFIVAIDASTGDEKWRAEREEKTSYSTPYIWRNKLRTELVVTAKTARSYDLKTGKVLWELKIAGEQTIPSPVGDEERLYMGNAGGQELKGNLFAVKAGAAGDITPKEGESSSAGVEWSFPDAGLGNASPLLCEGFIYIFSSRGDITCYNAVDGKQIYKQRPRGIGGIWASPWVYNDKIWFLDDKGVTRSVKTGEKYELLSQNSLDDQFWSSVAITGDAYIFKGAKKLFCVKE
jgi:outer membrane protein assembly factor BamB